MTALLPVRVCAWPRCSSAFRPGRTDQTCCSSPCERRLAKSTTPSEVARRTRAPRLCKATGCRIHIRGNADYCSEHSGSRHGRIPTVVGRVETEAAGRVTCPRCGGPIRVEGTLASCVDRSERDGERCGWVELTRRVVRVVTP